MICTYVQSAHVFESIFMKAQSINKILVSEKTCPCVMFDRNLYHVWLIAYMFTY